MATTRRQFLKNVLIGGGSVMMTGKGYAKTVVPRKKAEEIRSTVYRCVNGPPVQNMGKLIELLGGTNNVIGPDDIVVIKPNVQWWNQGAPNLLAVKTFVERIMERPGGFHGEVILAENCHRGPTPWQSKASGWLPRFERNSDIPDIHNFNELSSYLKKRYGNRFSTCHWINVDGGGRRVFGPAEGNGYVYCDGTGGVPLISYNNGRQGDNYRAVIMTYPIMTTDKGTVVDFKNGIWEKGAYTAQPLKFINFAALNNHSNYCGATSVIKNYLGVTDLSGGPDPHNGGKLTDKYYNFHSFPFNQWGPGPAPGMMGSEIGVFMKTIRKADLNITTAEWIGLATRTDPPVAHTRAVIASKDAVAQDFHTFKYILYPNSKIAVHNPDDEKSPVHQYLNKCAAEGGGVFDERFVKVNSYDFKTKSFQQDDELVISGEIDWGTKPKSILKYLILRYLNTPQARYVVD
jgi:hypothetical protein